MSSYLGQNFLTDWSILTRIATEVKNNFSVLWCDILIEIWPWKWALTKRILDITPQTLLIEYDQKMVDYLQTKLFPWLSTRPSLVNQDVLVWDESSKDDFPFWVCTDEVKKKTLVVGNLPYYITSPILRKFFACVQPIRAGWVFLIQKEVAEKIVYNAPKKSFLRWCINYAYHVEYCFSVSPEAFTPPPKVTSAVIRLTPKTWDQIPSLSYDDLLIFLDQYSPFKRKTLWASSKIVSKQQATSDKQQVESRKNKAASSKLQATGQKIWSLKLKAWDHIAFDISPYSHQRLEELGWDEMKMIIEVW